MSPIFSPHFLFEVFALFSPFFRVINFFVVLTFILKQLKQHPRLECIMAFFFENSAFFDEGTCRPFVILYSSSFFLFLVLSILNVSQKTGARSVGAAC
jgi:hypothetical protein